MYNSLCKKIDEMTLNEKTKIGVTVGQMLSIIIFIFGVSAGFLKVGAESAKAIEIAIDNKKQIESMKLDINLKSVETLKMFYEIRESQARIEEKLQAKQDKYKD